MKELPLDSWPALRNSQAETSIEVEKVKPEFTPVLNNVNNPNNILVTRDLHTYLQAATSANTRRAYQQDIRHFLLSGGLLPATPDTIIAYLQYHASQLNARTLERRLTAIGQWHNAQGFADPTAHLLVRKALTGIKNVHGKPKKKALALSVEDLRKLVSFLQKRNRLIDVRNNALLQIGFFGAFRRSELATLQLEHIRYVPEGIEILLPRSKADQAGEGQVCAIPYGEETLCPVTALKTWCEEAEITQGAVFRRITKGGKVTPEPIDAQHINSIIKAVAKAAGLSTSEQYSGHSLRRGFATEASQKGASLAAIMQQGRWRHTGTAIGYMEEGRRFEGNAADIVLKGTGEKRINERA